MNYQDMDVASRTFTNANILKVTVATTGYRGGDSGHGGRTEVVLEDESSTDISATFDELPRRVCIRVGGDAELQTLIEGLRFAADALDALSK